MNIILTGFMGTGKTSVGKRLAKRLGWRFVDLDQLIEISVKRPIAQNFADHGVAVFLRLERR
ncbi:MAG: AAA family ATPase [Candidatus Omnitrophica bacterium]|nr:AAA family ATPase [Candidatus Omnitrophota bacterium]